MMILVPLVALLFSFVQSSGIPGTTSTLNGYDTEFGEDAICWKSRGSSAATLDHHSHQDEEEEEEKIAFPNPLLEEFSLAGSVQLLQACPVGNSLQAMAPPEYNDLNLKETTTALTRHRLRTLQWYNYTIHASLNLTSLWESSTSKNDTSSLSSQSHAGIVSDQGPGVVAFQVVACVLGVSGFCSPFIHEEANERLAQQGIFTSPDRGDRHGDSHVHSPYIKVYLPPDEGPVYTNLTVTVPLLINDPADFYVIAAAQLYFGSTTDEEGGQQWRYDMANRLQDSQQLLSYIPPVVVTRVSRSTNILAWTAIGMAAAAILFLLQQTIRHYQHNILKLSQGPFLVVFLSMALMGVIASFLLEPKNDVYCQWSQPILLVTLQGMIAITLGRLWRIHAVISPLLMQTMHQRSFRDSKSKNNTTNNNKSPATWITSRIAQGWQRILDRLGGAGRRQRQSAIRQIRKQVTNTDLIKVIAVCTVPQVVLQSLALWLQPMEQTVELNQEKSQGRVICDIKDNGSILFSLRYVGIIVFGISMLLLLVCAYSARKLPSLLNETRVIYDSTLSAALVLVLCAILLLHVRREPGTSSPDVEYAALVFLILTMNLNMTIRTLWPKLSMIWKGEVVIVSRLVAADRQSRHGSQTISSSQHYSGGNGAYYTNNGMSTSSPTTTYNHHHGGNTGAAGAIPSGDHSNSSHTYHRPTSSGQYQDSATWLDYSYSNDHNNNNNMIFNNRSGNYSSSNYTSSHGGIPPKLSETSHDGDDGTVGNNSSSIPNLEKAAATAALHDVNTSALRGSSRTNHDAASLSLLVAEQDIKAGLPSPSSLPQSRVTFSEEEDDKDEEAHVLENHSDDDDDDVDPSQQRKQQQQPTTVGVSSWSSNPETATPRHRHSSHAEEGRTSKSSLMGEAEAKGDLHNNNPHHRRRHQKVMIHEGKAPSRHLVLGMVDLQEHLAVVNDRIIAGLAVPEEEWESLRRHARSFGSLMHHVEFSWEKNKKQQHLQEENGQVQQRQTQEEDKGEHRSNSSKRTFNARPTEAASPL